VTVAALDGLRVVDLTEGIAGGYATKVLADLGADVTTVERTGGSPLRGGGVARRAVMGPARLSASTSARRHRRA
jgi:crotonobetainyl-CoA:carnitine CoA-transferase CaiB-like acyl-CoA transferase